MTDFLSLLPPEKAAAIRERVAAESREAARLHGLPDRWLAESVLRSVRELRARHPDLSKPDLPGYGYSSALVWQVVPYLAKLAGCRTLPNEATDPELVTLRGDELREWVGYVGPNASPEHLARAYAKGEPSPVSFLTRDAANGSPIAMLLDRVAPPGPASLDKYASYLREISGRRGFAPTGAWTPDLQGPSPAEVADLWEDEPATSMSP